MSVEQATARYIAARREWIEAANALRCAVAADTRENLIHSVRRRRTWHEASQMAVKVQALAREHPDISQREIGHRLGLTRDLVCYYLSAKCKLPVKMTAA